MRTKQLSTIICLAVIPAHAASNYTITGEANTLTLEAFGAPLSSVLGGIAVHFDLCLEGTPDKDHKITGKYAGRLGDVLKEILPDYGYTIAYNDGAPRLVVIVRSSDGEATDITTLKPEHECSPSAVSSPGSDHIA